MTAAAEVLFETPSCMLAVAEHLLVMICKRPFSVEDAELEWQALHLLRERAPRERIAILIVLEPTAGFAIPADARDVIARSMREFGSNVIATAVVFETPGFGASIIRSIAAALSLLSRHPFPATVLASVPTALDWLQSKRVPPVAGWTEAVAALRARASIRCSA